MKRYLIFAGDHYYPCGGMHDFLFDVDEIKSIGVELIKFYEDKYKDYYNRDVESIEEYIKDDNDWLQIYDTHERKVIKNNILKEL